MLSVADIPFERRDVLELLGLRGEEAPDEQFDEHGWCRPTEVWLDDGSARCVASPLLIAAHTPDEPLPGPLMVELWVEHEGEPLAVRVPWTRFAEERIAPLLGPERDVVVALCNPQGKPLAPPPGLGGRTLHFAEGDVTAWLEPADGAPRISLTAQRWRTA
ncbi:MAG: hypothetical protein ACE37F_11410 [Nannocystaceae bacterium]|nr:hypothetical protein [bacterium]